MPSNTHLYGHHATRVLGYIVESYGGPYFFYIIKQNSKGGDRLIHKENT